MKIRNFNSVGNSIRNCTIFDGAFLMEEKKKKMEKIFVVEKLEVKYE